MKWAIMQPLYSLVGQTPAPAPYAGAKKEPGTRRGARSPGSKLPLLLFSPLPLLLSPLMPPGVEKLLCHLYL